MSRKTDHERSAYDSTGHYIGRTFNVAVVGLSGTEKEKGCLGVGKSCLCNRFIRPQADQYNRDHISILSQPDFSGPIVNNEHWLYWGETRKCTDEGFELTFSIVEQTEFVDDACFQPFKSGKSTDPYHKRCANTRLNSAEKLMYICKNQLGIEKEYEQHYLHDGKFNVDGFVCVFDVSEIQGRSIERQIDLTALILTSLLKTKKPVVLATTKNDESSELYVREAEKLVNRREFKGLIPLVETSAHDNVNVDLTFWACVQRDWPKGKTKILSYHEASQRQRDRLEIVNCAYLTLIQSNITDYRTHWNNTYSNLSQSQDFITYCDLFGQESAQQTFKRHVKKLKEEYVCRKVDMYLRRFPGVFGKMLPDLESFGPDHSWPSVQQILLQHPLFNMYFVLNEGLPWQEMDDTNETRIPFDLLQTPEAEKAFFDHLSSLLAEEQLRSLRYQFSELLRETSVTPGQPLKEIRDSLKGRECVDTLPESELKSIYEEYQKILQQDARDQLNELFLERTEYFIQYTTGEPLTHEDLDVIADELSKDERWQKLDLIPQDRRLALIRHLGFLQWPIKEHCFVGQACVEYGIEAYHSSLTKRNPRNPLWNPELDKIQIKFVVLGSCTYADNLATVVKAMCPQLEKNDPRIHYELQIVPSNETIGIFPFRPYSEAYLCVYSSTSSLDYLLKTLEQSTLLADLQSASLHQNPLPLVLLLACTPDTSSKERNYLREEGKNRAHCLQCSFFDVTSNEPHARFKSDELMQSLILLTNTLLRRYEMNNIYGHNLFSNKELFSEAALNPEIRILISLMCGDPISPARFLESIILFDGLQNSNFYPVTDHSFVVDATNLMSLEDEVLNEMPRCYVEFVVFSYHTSFSAYKDDLYHGNILVYWSKRQASFSNMAALASLTSILMPIQILALVENESRPSKLSHQLVANGQELANQLQAHFRVSNISLDMSRCIAPFLNYALQNKPILEKGLHIATAAAAAAAGVGENFEQQSPHSAISSEECLESAADEHFEAIMAPNINLNCSLDINSESKLISESIYERLPEEQHLSKGQFSHKDTQFNEFSSLVRQRSHSKKNNRCSNLESQENKAPNFGNFAANEEHLLKPSEMRHRRHINNNNNYYNLQSYPSADSLDQIYAIDSHYSHYDPATSSQLIIAPRQSAQPQPPPYSRAAISPPPAYKIHSPYQLEMTQCDPTYSNFQPNEPIESNTLAYYQRKYYPQMAQNSYSVFPNYSSAFSTVENENILIPDLNLMENYAGYKHSPLMYATTGHNYHQFHSRSQQQMIGRNFLNQSQRNPLEAGLDDSNLLHRHKKKKNKYSLKSRSSSLSHRMPYNKEADEDNDEHSTDELSKTKRSVLRSRKKRSLNRKMNQWMADNVDAIDSKSGPNKRSSPENVENLIENRNWPENKTENNVEDEIVKVCSASGDDESVSSNSTADDNATADKFAIVSGWEYQKNRKSPTNYQWPPVQSNDDNSMTNERPKMPGKINLKQFNNISDVFSRMNLGQRSANSTFDDNSSPFNSKDQLDDLGGRVRPILRDRLKTIESLSSKDVDSESDASDSNILNDQTSELSNINERIKFNSLKPSIGGLSQKKSQKKRHIMPVPVAPPRLPSSANSSNAVTPTSSGVGKSFTSFSSYDESQHEKLLSNLNNDVKNKNNFENFLDNITDECKMMDSGELRRNRWHQFSKLFSFPADNESGISVDENSLDAISEDTSASQSTNQFNAAKLINNNGTSSTTVDKAKFLKSKSIGTFSELDKKTLRKVEKMEKKRIKEEERKNRKNMKGTSRARSRSKGGHSSLEDFAQSNGNPVPLFIEKCTQFIEQEGLDMEGIYRVPGNRAHVETLLLKFDENPDINIAELDIPVNAVATALKDFFLKRLPLMFPPDSMTNIANLAKQYTDAGVLTDMQIFLLSLPNSNFQIIKHMISHFVKIVEKSSINSMDSKNLAICWWPTLLQFEFDNMDTFEQKRPHLMNFVQIMIDSYQELFINISTGEANLASHSCSIDELSSL